MKHILGSILLVVLLAAALPAAAQDEVCTQKGGRWDSTTGRCDISAKLDFTIHYPLEIVEYPFATQAVDAWLAEERASFFGPIIEYGLFSSPGPLTKQIDYETARFALSMFSLKFQISEYTGGAHGMVYFKTFNFDLANERVLALADLFGPGAAPLEVIAPLVRESLRAQLGDMVDEAWLEEGTQPVETNYENWLLTPDALVFYFPPYQMAAYAAGPQTVSLPLSALSDMLDLRFMPSAAS